MADSVAVGGAGSLKGSTPICVDLDGTLVRTDMLAEGVLGALGNIGLYRALLGLRNGNRAQFKHAIAAAGSFDPSTLPYEPAFLAFLRQQRHLGRRLFLVTAADVAVANRIAEFLGIFDEVIASDGVRNLKGKKKAEFLQARFGQHGFCYAGDSSADLPVWKVASSGILVNARMDVALRARGSTNIEAEFKSSGSLWHALLKAMRPHQWVKNILVFIPLFISGGDINPRSLSLSFLTFVAFSLTASGIYLLNDLTDLAADRRHPRKRERAIASGAVPVVIAVAASIILVTFGTGVAAGAGIFAIVGTYALLSVGYSARLKELPLVDVFMLGALYTIRLVGGGEATGHRVSLWLLAFSSFLFLSLALLKRVGELGNAPVDLNAALSRRGYVPSDVALLQMFGCSTSVAASLVLALFIQNEATAERYASPALLWGIVPLILFWLCRIWLSTTRGYMHDDPIVYAAKDWVSWLVAIATAALVVAARFSGRAW